MRTTTTPEHHAGEDGRGAEVLEVTGENSVGGRSLRMCSAIQSSIGRPPSWAPLLAGDLESNLGAVGSVGLLGGGLERGCVSGLGLGTS